MGNDTRAFPEGGCITLAKEIPIVSNLAAETSLALGGGAELGGTIAGGVGAAGFVAGDCITGAVTLGGLLGAGGRTG